MDQLLFIPSLDRLAMFGIISALLSVMCFLPYIRDTLLGKTQPERASWLIWSVLGSISLASQIYEGAGASLWFATVQVGGTVLICLLSITKGAGAYLSPRNKLVFLLAGLGLVSWYMTETALYALLLSVSISLLGGCLTIAKSYRAPESETLSTWVMGWAASVCGVISVGAFDLVLLAYPLYLVTLYSAIIAAVCLGRLARLNAEIRMSPQFIRSPYRRAEASARTPHTRSDPSVFGPEIYADPIQTQTGPAQRSTG